MAKKVIGFSSEDDFRKVRETVQKVRGQRKRGAQHRRQSPVVSDSQFFLAKTTEEVSADSSGGFEFYAGTLGSETGTGSTSTAYNRGDAIPSGTWIHVCRRSGGFEMFPIVCP